MKRAVVVLIAVVMLSPLLGVCALLASAGQGSTPSSKALGEVPAELMPLYRSAASTCDGLDWSVLAAIHKVETNFGRGHAVSSAGAQGPMQFMPATWRAYGVDGDGDGFADINDVEDALYSAAHLLCANGAGDPARVADAIWNYNHSDAYVTDVLALSDSYSVASFVGLGAVATSDLLANPNIVLSPDARVDIETGVVDPRLISLLDFLAQRHTLGISVFQTGHSIYVDGTSSISNHYFGRAVDISQVDGLAVSSVHSPARGLVNLMSSLPADVRPTEIGHPFADLDVPGGFSDRAHADHLHFGFD